MIIKTLDRMFTISGLYIQEPEWFPEGRDDIFDIWFQTKFAGPDEPRKVPRIGDYVMVDFITGGHGGEIWGAGPITEIVEYTEGEPIGNQIFKAVGPPKLEEL